MSLVLVLLAKGETKAKSVSRRQLVAEYCLKKPFSTFTLALLVTGVHDRFFSAAALARRRGGSTFQGDSGKARGTGCGGGFVSNGWVWVYTALGFAELKARGLLRVLRAAATDAGFFGGRGGGNGAGGAAARRRRGA
jgi:hypothetical protein